MATVTLLEPTNMSALPTSGTLGGASWWTSYGQLMWTNNSYVHFLGQFIVDSLAGVQGPISRALINGTDGSGAPNLDITGISFSITFAYWNALRDSGNVAEFVGNLMQGNDTVVGTPLSDTLLGFNGNDTLIGGDRGDALNGGNGFDTVTYASSPAAVNINLAGDPGAGGHAAGDRIFEVEQLIGSNFNDILGGGTVNSTVKGLGGNDFISGGIGNNMLFGDAGNDILNGDAGIDVLTGGAGRDMLFGGLGADRFDFNSIKESKKGGSRDKIMDFERGPDHIDLKDIDAQTGGGNQAFKWIGKSKFHEKKGELRYEDKGATVIVQGDTNGDGKADFEIFVNIGSLAKGDFIL
ncbi:MAG: calcium-binding protein [Methyloceanibacter sp.]|uniref:calcium-binding protein n=1 Tax=Methyloceanibacter sp. TaxID=1965321 RepID=UPI003D6DA1CA